MANVLLSCNIGDKNFSKYTRVGSSYEELVDLKRWEHIINNVSGLRCKKVPINFPNVDVTDLPFTCEVCIDPIHVQLCPTQ
jgi:hypothetical protein